MARLRVFLSRLFGLSSRRKRDADLRAEIDAHIAEAAEDFERQGVPADEARRPAFVQFGGVTQTIETHREQRRFRPLGGFGRDLAYGADAREIRGLHADCRAHADHRHSRDHHHR
jgi:hypothetical protein